MYGKPDDFLLQAWKQQLDTGLRVIEALVEGSTRLREVQLEAAAAAHADIAATRKSLASASDVARLLELQVQWGRANAQQCADYWRKLQDVAVQTQSDLAGCFQIPPSAPAVQPDKSKEVLLNLMDQAYKQWLEATQQFYRLPVPSVRRPENRAAA